MTRSQYDMEIDKSNLSAVGKFSYLKELLDPRARALINGLSFNTEGYERAKNILVIKFSKQSEVVNALIQSVMNLPTIRNPRILWETNKPYTSTAGFGEVKWSKWLRKKHTEWIGSNQIRLSKNERLMARVGLSQICWNPS